MLVLGLSSVFTQTDTHEHNAMSLAQLSTSSLIYRDKQKSVLIKEVPLERSCTQEGCSRTGEELFAVCVATERWDVHTHTHTKKLTFIMRIMSYVLVGNSPGRLQ